MTCMHPMKLVACTMLAGLLAVPGAVYGDDDEEAEFRARLSGAEEVPPVGSDTGGRFRVRFNDSLTSAEYQLRVNEGERVTQAHLHCAPRGSNGPVVVFLAGFHALGWDIDGKWISNATFTDDNVLQGATPSATCPETIDDLADLAAAMDNGNIYVNVHSVANRGGEVRGQVVATDDDDD